MCACVCIFIYAIMKLACAVTKEVKKGSLDSPAYSLNSFFFFDNILLLQSALNISRCFLSMVLVFNVAYPTRL